MTYAIDELPTPCMVTSESGLVMDANDLLETFIGCSRGELLGACVDSFITPASRIFFQTHVWPTLLKHRSVGEVFCHMQSRSGQRLAVYVSARKLHRGDQPVYMWVLHVTEERQRYETALIEARKQAQQHAREIGEAHELLRNLHVQLQQKVSDTEAQNRSLTDLALKDGLTQLGNRRSLQHAAVSLSEGSIPGSTFSVLMLDIDHFKSVNDTHGHDRGDAVLVDVAACLQQVARESDFAIRYGGEEFVLILNRVNIDQASAVADRIHREIGRKRPGSLDVTVSIGVATSADWLDDLFRVLKVADEALYEAKRTGRNRTVTTKM